MKAVGYYASLAAEDPQALVDIELPEPVATGRDLLIEVRAISVNPIDTKLRRTRAPSDGKAYVLGYDAAGIVHAVGDEASLFKVGDEVFYAGLFTRQGSNAELQLVDERIVGRKPASLNFEQAAALPLTAITAWELLFDRMRVPRNDNNKEPRNEKLLIIGGAGGVGSIMIQLARQLTPLTVIATASRAESKQWCLELGAHHVIDHSKPLADELRSVGMTAVNHIASLTHTQDYFADYIGIIAPQGSIGLIDDIDGLVDIRTLKAKAISLHWESMFVRPIYDTPDLIEQHHLLNTVSAMVDAGQLRSTHGQSLGAINAVNLRKAHQLIESGATIGKLTLAGFD